MAPRGRKWKQSEIIDAFKQTHGNTYDYSRVVYTDVDTNVWIGCKKHPKSPLADENGIVWFQQTPHHHIAGEGCPMCNESHGERTIAQLLTTADITYERHKEFEWLPKRCHVDIYLPDYNVAIEYQGELHYLPKFGQAELVKQQQRDSIKKRLCKQNNLPLYEITYKDDIEQKLKEILDSVSGNTVQQTINNTTNESNTHKNMKKNVIKVSENTLRQIVAESVEKALKEYEDRSFDSDEFYGEALDTAVQTYLDSLNIEPRYFATDTEKIGKAFGDKLFEIANQNGNEYRNKLDAARINSTDYHGEGYGGYPY